MCGLAPIKPIKSVERTCNNCDFRLSGLSASNRTINECLQTKQLVERNHYCGLWVPDEMAKYALEGRDMIDEILASFSE